MTAIIMQWIVIFATFLLLFWVNQGRTTREKKAIVAYMGMGLMINAGYLFEQMAQGQTAAFLALQIEYGGLIFMGFFVCMFFFTYTRRRVPQWVAGYVLAFDGLMLVLTWTGNYHQQIFKNVGFRQLLHGYSISFTRGSMYIFLAIGCELLPFLLSLYAVISYIKGELSPMLRKKVIWATFFILGSYMCEVYFFAGFHQGGYRFTAAFGLLLLDLFALHFFGGNVFNLETAAINSICETMSEGAIVMDPKGALLYYNPAAKEIFPELSIEMFRRSLMRLHSFPLELVEEFQRKELWIGERFFQVIKSPIVDPWSDVCGYVLLLQDQTKEIGLQQTVTAGQETLVQMKEEVERAKREEQKAKSYKGEFLKNISHEIRTPMNAIVGLSELIIEESRGRKVYDFACDIKNASMNLLTIIGDVLCLSKLDDEQMKLKEEPYDTQQLFEETLHLSKVQAASNGLRLIRKISKDLPCRLIGDADRIRWLIQNCMDFAIRFTKRGFVQLVVTHEWIDEERVVLQLQFEHSAEDLDVETFVSRELFKCFSEADEAASTSFDNTHLTIALTKRFVELMGGEITTGFEPGIGTSMTIRLQQRISDSRTIEQHPWRKHDVTEEIGKAFIAPDCRVLVVDDNKINLKVAVGALSIYRFQIDEAKSGAQAIEMVKDKAYDLIFMDHMMPEMDGIEATDHIRRECGENGKNAIIIALSANAYSHAADMFIQNGFQDFIAKPLDKFKLYDILCKWIPKERRMTVEGSVEAEEKIAGTKVKELYMPGIDVHRAIAAHTGGVEDYIELLELFYMDGQEKQGLIRHLSEECDYKNFEIEVHGLKSASANIGAEELSSLAKEHEMAAKEGNYTFIDENLSKLLAEYVFLLREIERVLKSIGRLKEETAEKEGELLSMEESRQGLQEILEDIENFRSKEAAAKVEQLLSKHLEKSVNQCLKDVRNKLKMYDDDTAEELLRAFLGAGSPEAIE